MLTLHKKFANSMKNERRARGLNQDELGVFIRRSVAHISKVESGDAQLNLKECERDCQVLGMDLRAALYDMTPAELEASDLFHAMAPQQQALALKVLRAIRES